MLLPTCHTIIIKMQIMNFIKHLSYFKLLSLIVFGNLILIALINFDYINYFTIVLILIVCFPYLVIWEVLQYFLKKKATLNYYRYFTIVSLFLFTLIFIFQ